MIAVNSLRFIWPVAVRSVVARSLLAKLPRIELTLLIGQYAQRHFLAGRRKASLAETAKAWREYAPRHIPLPHPSPRNQPWFKRHPWFEAQLVPMLQPRIKTILAR